LDHESYEGLGFHAKDTPEFQEVRNYFEEKSSEALVKGYPQAAKELLEVMKSDQEKFFRMVAYCNHKDSRYYETPIFSYVSPEDFVSALLSLSPGERRTVRSALDERYNSNHFNMKLAVEVDWLESVVKLLQQAREARQGKMSGYFLERMITQCLNNSISQLKASNHAEVFITEHVPGETGTG
jgi:hypothetical protein